MKKLFYFILVAGLSLAAASCQNIDEQVSGKKLNVTGTIVDFESTKVSYEFSETDNPKSGLKASWEVGDSIFGFDDKGVEFTFTVSEVNDGKASFDTGVYTPAENVTTLYAVYYPGKTEFDGNKELAVDLSNQDGSLGSDSPAIMCATGTIENGNVMFDFTNQTSIVGIYKMQIQDGDATVASTTITGVTLSNVTTTGTVKVDDGELKLIPGSGVSSISASGLSLTTDADGYINVDPSALAPYFAVIPAKAQMSISATDGTKIYNNLSTISESTLKTGTYYYIGKKLGTTIVATIGTIGYATIDDAFRAVVAGQTIVLNNDCSFGTQVTLAGKSGEITLDLNGHTLKNGPIINDKRSRIYLNQSDVTLTIKDSETGGTITSDDPDEDVIKVVRGNLKIMSGTVLTASSSSNTTNAAIWVEGSDNASVIISGGNINGHSEAKLEDKRSYALYVSNTNASVLISSGSFSSQSNNLRIMKAKSVDITGGNFDCQTKGEYAMRFAGDYTCNIGGENLFVSAVTYPVCVHSGKVNLNIKGGSFKSDVRHINKGGDASGATISITGGKFSFRSSSLASYLSDGYGIAKISDGDYKYEVIQPEDGCKAEYTTGGNTFRYITVTDAFDDVSDTCTVKLLGNHTMTKKLNLGYDNTLPSGVMTLDLNGYTLKADESERRIQIQPNENSSKLTITDSSVDKQGKYTQTEAGKDENLLTIGYGGTFTLESGTVESIGEGSIYAQRSNINIKGGTVSGNSSKGSIQCSASNCTVTISGGTVTSTSNVAIIAKGTVRITGGTVKSDADVGDISAIYIGGGSVIVDGEDALITLPNLDATRAATPVIQVESGSLTLIKGKIGGLTGSKGNQTAVRLVSGTFTMQGGCVEARRHAITLNGSSSKGNVQITGGELYNINTASNYNLIRFAGTTSGTVTINGQNAYLFSIKPGHLFGVGSTGEITNGYSSKIIISEGFFNEDISNVYSGKITLNGTCSTLTTPQTGPSGKTYNYQVTSTNSD